MGFLSKKKDESDESTRNALFGNRKKDKASSAAANPYANPPADPYSNPPPAYSGGDDQYRRDKSPAVTAQGGAYGGGYGNQGGSYGGPAGYGSNRYETGPKPQRQGGYGGMGGGATDDSSRDQLFGNASKRYQERAPNPPSGQQYGQSGGYGQSQSGAYGQSQSGAYGSTGGTSGASGAPGGYGSYDDRKELTAEEQEEEDINVTKNEIKFMKQKDVSSTRNALRLAQQAEETGRDTLARLAAQGERIHNTEKNLDLASTQNRIAEEKARELKTLNKSMFAVHIGNPFTSQQRQEQRDAEIMDRHRADRDARDATRKAAWESAARGDAINRELKGQTGPGKKGTLADRAKYQFEADSEDDEMENEIDSNLDALHGAARRLNTLGRAMGAEVETQNKHLDRLNMKTDKVDEEIAKNRAKLDRIH